MSSSTFTARVITSTGADVAAALSAAVGALSGPLHGGAPARVLQMIQEVEAAGDATTWVKQRLDRGERIMGFGHRVYRAEDPRARVLRRIMHELDAPRIEVAEALERAALEELQARRPERILATNIEFWAAVVLDFAEVPPALYTPMFGCARVAGWSAHILEQKREGRMIRPSAKYVGSPPRPLSASSLSAPMRVLVLSWEYPPVIEGGLGRHVRKLSERLVAAGVEVHVLTRGGGQLPADESRHGVHVHRVTQPPFPRDVERFLRWVKQMNRDMAAAASELAERFAFDLVHSHDWLVSDAAEEVARGAGVPWLVTIHATEYGRHQGWVKKHPQSRIHAAERRMARRRRPRDHLLRLHGRARGAGLRGRVAADHGDPQRHRPRRSGRSVRA